MILRQDDTESVDTFYHRIVSRLPLADAVLSLWAFVMEPAFLESVFERHRGRSFTELLTFPTFVELLADALWKHSGSGRQAFTRAREADELPSCIEAVYGKLRRLPLTLSQGFFEEATSRLRQTLPDGLAVRVMPASMDQFTIVVVDGKILKNVAKRLLVSRGKAGKLYGGKLLVAYVPEEGLARSFVADPDGETNDAKLIPRLIPQARQIITGKPRLWVLDRQFCDLTQPPLLAEGHDHFLIRYHPKNKFSVDDSRLEQVSQNAQGQTVIEDWGWLGAENSKRRLFVRRIRLQRPGEEEIILVTDLIDSDLYPVLDLLLTYLERWGIERVFQQITEVFHLEHLIGSTPQATIFQASFCLTMYNMLQVIRHHVAAAQPEPCSPETLSTEEIFRDATRQLTAISETVPTPQIAAIIPRHRNVSQLNEHLRRCLTLKLPKRWIKTRNKKPRANTKRATESGAHTSVARLLKAAASPPAAALKSYAQQ
jgi:hypothetical protein